MRLTTVPMLLASTTCLACAAPGTTMPTEGTLRDPQGSTSGGVAAAWTGDFPGSESGGSVIGGARVSHQIVRNVAIAGDVAFGRPFIGSVSRPPAGGSTPFTGVFSTRAHVRVSPDSDHVAFIGGIGGGAITGHSGMGFFDLDAGVRVGTHYRRLIEGYLGEDIVWSYAIYDAGGGAPTNPPYVFYFVTDAGIIGHATPRLAIGADLSMYLAVGSNGQFFGQSSNSRPFFVPGLWVRYTFGGTLAAGE